MITEQPAFSLIVPVYNGAAVIERCIESVLHQTHSLYELIVIDDGSRDDTESICRWLAGTDSRIRYHRQTNKGVSATRNEGLALAQNEWILFVDADDYLSPACLHGFAQLLQKEDVDGKTYFFQDFLAELQDKEGKQHTYKWCNLPYQKLSLAEAFHQLPRLNWLPWGVPFAKLFRLSIIRKNNIAFKEAITFKEDSIFIMEYLQYIDTIVFDPTTNYHYTIDQSKQSLSNTVASYTSESLFFAHFKRLSDYFIQKYQLSTAVQQILYEVIYVSFFRAINSCLYQHKLSLSRQQRIQNIRELTTPANLQHLKASGVINSRMKQLAFVLLQRRLYGIYDLLNTTRYRHAS